jgi:hypothetical protein
MDETVGWYSVEAAFAVLPATLPRLAISRILDAIEAFPKVKIHLKNI